ncbi:MAG: hypothetical protein RL346_284 [Verrucomicrobiota bacterium]|jgi:pyridoxal phosphate enzyme (YggS family)
MSGIAENLERVCANIAAACARSCSEVSSVRLIAISKTVQVHDIATAVGAGQRVFGESRQQEAVLKIAELPAGLEWHFIGRVQRNKVRKILPWFEFVHAVDSLDLAESIDRIAGELGLSPKIFLQVNQAGEESKGGFRESVLRDAMPGLLRLNHARIVGLMAIPPATEEPEESRHWFAELRRLRDEVVEDHGMSLPFLSMGMSGDYGIAIEEGATHVRVGSAIFGKRASKIEGEL